MVVSYCSPTPLSPKPVSHRGLYTRVSTRPVCNNCKVHPCLHQITPMSLESSVQVRVGTTLEVLSSKTRFFSFFSEIPVTARVSRALFHQNFVTARLSRVFLPWKYLGESLLPWHSVLRFCAKGFRFYIWWGVGLSTNWNSWLSFSRDSLIFSFTEFFFFFLNPRVNLAIFLDFTQNYLQNFRITPPPTTSTPLQPCHVFFFLFSVFFFSMVRVRDVNLQQRRFSNHHSSLVRVKEPYMLSSAAALL